MYIPAWPSLSPAYFVKSSVADGLPFPLCSESNAYFYVARSGIYHLSRSLGLDKGGVILVPDYHHGNEIFALKAAGAKLRFYAVKKNLDADLDSIRSLWSPEVRALYVTHFIGWPQPMPELQAFCREREVTLIEDCALSFMSELGGKPLGTFGDYSVFCLYKSLPVPNGGVLANNRERRALPVSLQACSSLSVAGRSAELILNWIRTRHERCGRALIAVKRTAGRALKSGGVKRVPVGDTGFDLSSVNVGMSRLSETLLPRFRYDWIKEIRRRNFTRLEQHLKGKVLLIDRSLSDGVCPLFFPLLVKDKQSAASQLAVHGISTVQFWNGGDPEARRPHSDAEFLRRHVLEVPIHQDVTAEGVDHMAKQITSLRLGLAA